MVYIDITERVISYLGLSSGTSSVWENSDFSYDYAVAGIPFVSAANDRTPYVRSPYKRGLVTARREQVDQQQSPGEQSLTGWWLRSQANFTGGAGISFYEPTSDERTMRRFKDSLGVDCWTVGKLSLLNATTASAAYAGRAWPLTYGSTVYWVYGATVDRAGTTTALTAGSNLSITDDGTNFYRLTSSGLYKGTLASGGDAAYYTTTPTTGTVVWAKGRLMAGLDQSIYELTGSGAPTLPTALYTHPNSAWAWSSICEGPSAIYAAGSAGNRSAIYKFSIDTQLAGTSLPALTRGSVVAELPSGEVITAISSYLGRYLGICTNKGFRVAIIDGNGDLTYGPLIWTSACYSMFGQDRFFFVGTTLSSGPGVIRVDLSDPDNDGRFPYATDLQSGQSGSGYVTAIAQIGTSDLKAFATWDATNSYRILQSTDRVASGWIRFGQVRYSTLEPKHFELVKVRWAKPLDGTIAISTIGDDLVETSLITVGSDSESIDFGVNSTSSSVSLGVRLDLARSSTDVTKSPEVNGWQFKAVPAVVRKEMLEVPLLAFDFQRDKYSTQTGYEGFALDRYAYLRDAVASGDVVSFQDLSNGETLQVVVEQIDFEQNAPPGIASGFGGIITLTLREV